MDIELDHFLRLLTDFSNPVYYAFVFILFFIFLIYITYRQILIPRKLTYEFEKEGLNLKTKDLELEKNKLESDTLRFLSAFTESDPNPIVRTDSDGIVIHANTSAQKAFGIFPEEREHFSKILNENILEIKSEIAKNSNIHLDKMINGKQYTMFFYGISSLGMAQIYFFDLSERYIYEKKLLESEQKFRSLSFYLHDQLEAEKQRIGMELHDSIGQNLLFVNLKLKDAASDFNKYQENYSTVESAMDTTIKDLREIMYDLKPRFLDEQGLFAAICSLSDKMSCNFKIKGSVDCSGTPERLEIKTELYLYRIIQESLSNILKHSFAREYHIQFIYSECKLKIIISDNGVGFDTENVFKSKGFGLFNMSERIKNLNGKMQIESDAQSGTIIFFELPIIK